MEKIKVFILMLFMFFSNNVLADDLFALIKQVNKHIASQGLKVQDYRPALDYIKGYELNLVVSNPSLATSQEPIKHVYLNKDFNTAIFVYKDEEIHQNLRNDTHLKLTSMFSKIFQNDTKNYKRLPLFKAHDTTPYSEDLRMFHNSQRSFIINEDKTYVASAKVLFFNGQELSEYSDDKRKIALLDIKNTVKDIYEKQEQITFITSQMKNLLVVFYSNSQPHNKEIFKNIPKYNEDGIGLLFLPYHDIQKDKNTTKDYQLFCQKDFGLIVEYAILEGNTSSKEFECANSNKDKVNMSTNILLDIYKARNDILSKFDIDFTRPYYYLYQQELFLDYDFHKELY